MRGVFRVGAMSKAAIAVVSVAVVSLPSSVVMADDAGVRAFFRQESGMDVAPTRQAYAEPEIRSLVVRPHRRTVRRVEPTRVAVAPTGPVSIYDDPTLRPGDAVMTAKGLRVFMGGHSAPYAETDFVALSEADGLPRQVQKALAAVDQAPHG